MGLAWQFGACLFSAIQKFAAIVFGPAGKLAAIVWSAVQEFAAILFVPVEKFAAIVLGAVQKFVAIVFGPVEKLGAALLRAQWRLWPPKRTGAVPLRRRIAKRRGKSLAQRRRPRASPVSAFEIASVRGVKF